MRHRSIGFASGSDLMMCDSSFAPIDDLESGSLLLAPDIDLREGGIMSSSRLSDLAKLSQVRINTIDHCRDPADFDQVTINRNLTLGVNNRLLIKVGNSFLSRDASSVRVGDQLATLEGLVDVNHISRTSIACSFFTIGISSSLMIVRLENQGLIVFSGKSFEPTERPGWTRAPNHFTVSIVNNFLHSFSSTQELPPDLIIQTSQTGAEENHHPVLYCRKEPLNNPNVVGKFKDILLTCIDDDESELIFDRRIFVTFAALSYFSRRNCDPHRLLQPVGSQFCGDKTEGCCGLISNRGNDQLNASLARDIATREQLCYELSGHMEIIQPATNWKRYSTLQFDDAVQIQTPYVFSLAFENSVRPGWITEKIINSFLAGCIPIFYGSDDVKDFFNPKAFINVADFSSPDSLADFLKKVGNDRVLLNQYLAEPPCKPEQLRRLFYWLDL